MVAIPLTLLPDVAPQAHADCVRMYEWKSKKGDEWAFTQCNQSWKKDQTMSVIRHGPSGYCNDERVIDDHYTSRGMCDYHGPSVKASPDMSSTYPSGTETPGVPVDEGPPTPAARRFP